MLQGFENHTGTLTDADKLLIDVIVDGLRPRVGKINAISNRQIRESLQNNTKITFKHPELKEPIERLNDIKIREIINHIRNSQKIKRLCACGKGYYIASTPAEFKEWLSSLQGRINEEQRLLQLGENQLNEWAFGYQPKLL